MNLFTQTGCTVPVLLLLHQKKKISDILPFYTMTYRSAKRLNYDPFSVPHEKIEPKGQTQGGINTGILKFSDSSQFEEI